MPLPSPEKIFAALEGFRRTAAMKTAIELDLFSAIAEQVDSVEAIAERCGCAPRGVRILCDYLCMLGFLRKETGRYSLSADAAAFLVRSSPAYLASAAAEARAGEALTDAFGRLTDAVRTGKTALSSGGVMAPEHPAWPEFARATAIPSRDLARLLAERLDVGRQAPMKVLDIAAGHGLYGISVAEKNSRAEIFAVDWPQVLAVARENAVRAGVADRFHSIAGDAFTIEFGNDYDLALITNFLPDLDSVACEKLLRKIRSALKRDGRAAVFELVLNDDRVSPAPAVNLNLGLLAATPGGEARTAAELETILHRSGFSSTEAYTMPQLPFQIIVGHH